VSTVTVIRQKKTLRRSVGPITTGAVTALFQGGEGIEGGHLLGGKGTVKKRGGENFGVRLDDCTKDFPHFLPPSRAEKTKCHHDVAPGVAGWGRKESN